MLPKDAVPSDHVNVVGAGPALCALDEERIPGTNIAAESGPPKVVVTLGAQNGRDLGASSSKAGDFHQHVNDRLRGKARNGRAAKVLDP